MKIDKRILSLLIRGMLEFMEEKGFYVPALQAAFIDDCTIARLNETFMNCPGPTNVLSFPDCEGGEGELFISMDTLAREALMYGQKACVYLTRLLAHGLCHLAGMDHGDEMEHFQQLLEKNALDEKFPEFLK